MFRRIRSVIKATMLEVVSEPLFFLLTLTAVGVLSLASLLHIHQFGEPSRMARDVGLSAVLIFGIVFAVFASIRVFRREIESGTLQMALSRPISRETFFFSKAAGVFFGYLCFFAVVFSSAVTTVVGSEVARISAELAAAGRSCSAPHENVLPETMWGISLAADAAVIVVPVVSGAFFNRFFRFRFTTTAFVTALIVSCAGCALNLVLADCLFHDRAAGLYGTALRLLPAGVLITIPAIVFLSLASAFSVRLKDNAVSSLAALFFLLFIPALGNYYQTQALSMGGELPWSYVASAFFAALPFVAAFLLAGAFFMRSRDVG